MKPRHIAQFNFNDSINNFVNLFLDEIKKNLPEVSSTIKDSKYSIQINLINEGEEFSYSIAQFPNEAKLILFVEPKLKFFQALFGKKDLIQHNAINLAHRILKDNNQITNLGWLLSQQAYKRATENP